MLETYHSSIASSSNSGFRSGSSFRKEWSGSTSISEWLLLEAYTDDAYIDIKRSARAPAGLPFVPAKPSLQSTKKTLPVRLYPKAFDTLLRIVLGQILCILLTSSSSSTLMTVPLDRRSSDSKVALKILSPFVPVSRSAVLTTEI